MNGAEVFTRNGGAEVTAVKWFAPSPTVDQFGVRVTTTEGVLSVPQGEFRIRHGDWLVTNADGVRWVVEKEVFDSLYARVPVPERVSFPEEG